MRWLPGSAPLRPPLGDDARAGGAADDQCFTLATASAGNGTLHSPEVGQRAASQEAGPRSRSSTPRAWGRPRQAVISGGSEVASRRSHGGAQRLFERRAVASSAPRRTGCQATSFLVLSGLDSTIRQVPTDIGEGQHHSVFDQRFLDRMASSGLRSKRSASRPRWWRTQPSRRSPRGRVMSGQSTSAGRRRHSGSIRSTRGRSACSAMATLPSLLRARTVRLNDGSDRADPEARKGGPRGDFHEGYREAIDGCMRDRPRSRPYGTGWDHGTKGGPELQRDDSSPRRRSSRQDHGARPPIVADAVELKYTTAPLRQGKLAELHSGVATLSAHHRSPDLTDAERFPPPLANALADDIIRKTVQGNGLGGAIGWQAAAQEILASLALLLRACLTTSATQAKAPYPEPIHQVPGCRRPQAGCRTRGAHRRAAPCRSSSGSRGGVVRERPGGGRMAASGGTLLTTGAGDGYTSW